MAICRHQVRTRKENYCNCPATQRNSALDRGDTRSRHSPFGSSLYDIEQATIVLIGRCEGGKAHGDGMIRESTSFDLLPYVGAIPSFATTLWYVDTPTPPAFHLVTNYEDPFVPEVIPLPTPDQGPPEPISFFVRLTFGPSLGTKYPPGIGQPPFFVDRGYIVDEPMVLHIDEAYILLSGALSSPSHAPVPCSLPPRFACCGEGRAGGGR